MAHYGEDAIERRFKDKIHKARASVAYWREMSGLAEQRIAELEGILSGDPDMTARKHDREAWRLSAIRWSDKVEAAFTRLLDAVEAASRDDQVLCESHAEEGRDLLKKA